MIRSQSLALYMQEVDSRLQKILPRLAPGSYGKQWRFSVNAEPAVGKRPLPDVGAVFYEARGVTWALYHILKALETDFNALLSDGRQLATLRQVIRALEDSQAAVSSPAVLNGGEFGIFSNYPQTMVNCLNRAYTVILELRDQLMRGPSSRQGD